MNCSIFFRLFIFFSLLAGKLPGAQRENLGQTRATEIATTSSAQHAAPAAKLLYREKKLFLECIKGNIPRDLWSYLDICRYKFNPNDFNQPEFLQEQNLISKLRSGDTLLHCYIKVNSLQNMEGTHQIVYFVVKNGGNINAIDAFGNTALQILLNIPQTAELWVHNTTLYSAFVELVGTLLCMGGYAQILPGAESRWSRAYLTLNHYNNPNDTRQPINLHSIGKIDSAIKATQEIHTLLYNCSNLWKKHGEYQTWLHWYLNQPGTHLRQSREEIEKKLALLENRQSTGLLAVYLNIRDRFGRTPLHYAAIWDAKHGIINIYTGLGQFLTRRGAQDLPDNSGMTASMLFNILVAQRQ